ncbi:MAG: COX15/CtaA family protein [Gammaproteobacteria bacterium]
MNATQTGSERQIASWLLVCCAILFSLIVLGGVTRLTGSGLSITEWRPVTGMLPPFSEQAWQSEFDLYRASPEYRVVNRGMSLAEFKMIYAYEYAHRLLARMLGLAFAIPLLWFWLRGRIPVQLRWPLLGLLGLGMLQGYMGWFMVASGLVDIPRVSPYRLAAHLSLAMIIYAAMFWLALGLLRPRATPAPAIIRSGLRPLLLVLVVTILSGAFVAGLKAGFVYNTFPLMGGQWVPDGLFHLEPVWRNWFENPATVQFTHRVLGLSTLAITLFLWVRALRLPLSSTQRLAFHGLAVAVIAQATLGIKTLLMFVPVGLGAAHQGGAVVVLSAVLFALHETGRAPQAIATAAPVGASAA